MKRLFAVGVCLFFLFNNNASSSQQPTIRISQNQAAAGMVRNGVLTVRLEITEGVWHPEADDGPSLTMEAFAEAGKGPQIPGPLIRVQEGQRVSITILNRMRDTARVFGLHERPGPAGHAIEIPPGQTRSVRFTAGAPGMYYYWATTTNSDLNRPGIDGQLSGAYVVEPKGTTDHLPIFIIGYWKQDPRALWVINGKMWPHTPRFIQKVGAPLRTGWINASTHHHPMHLHGAYYTLLGEGDQELQTIYSPEHRPLVTTHDLVPGATMIIEWTPLHTGNWMFHCHIPFHTDWLLGLNPPPFDSVHGEHTNHMAGLAIGFTAVGPPEKNDSVRAPRRLDLYVAERDKRYAKVETFPEPLIGMGYQLQENNSPLAPPSSPGPLMILKREEPVEITIHNQLKEITAVHWHGIELESYYDGVPGWSGSGTNLAPAIHPGATFTAKFTPPRSGSFMYHTHMNDLLQVGMGLEGPLIVLDPDQTFDPGTDKILFITRDGVDDEHADFLLNGSATPPPMPLPAGKRCRLRFFMLSIARRAEIHLLKDGAPVSWTAIAKDGADLPQPTAQPAVVLINTGETWDFEWTPEAGDYKLEARTPTGTILFTLDIPARESSP